MRKQSLPVTLYRDEDGWYVDELGPGLLRDQIRKAGLTIEEFITLL